MPDADGGPDLIMIDELTCCGEEFQCCSEQKLTIALKVSGRVPAMGNGRIMFEGTPDDLDRNPAIRSEWLEV